MHLLGLVLLDPLCILFQTAHMHDVPLHISDIMFLSFLSNPYFSNTRSSAQYSTVSHMLFECQCSTHAVLYHYWLNVQSHFLMSIFLQMWVCLSWTLLAYLTNNCYFPKTLIILMCDGGGYVARNNNSKFEIYIYIYYYIEDFWLKPVSVSFW